ncbi:transglutaminase domain-containing protein [Mariniflexile gromovii]|uniref:DUF3857 domain-containing protein n=1 Tax=Mariniflexile gromovii TaxID=362523 RepID=A0ABS4BYF0_9FLAO|nr:transglutaminase domain-containing protein [Mariniflexile gromovii]MBP0905067.1 DUF3857 domain-containing protein [Mariniflexile gromovii]
MKNRLLIFLFVAFNAIQLSSQNTYNKFWDALLNNDRVLAEKNLKSEKNKNIEFLITNEILREEMGKFVEHPEFTKLFLEQPDFENYLYGLWNKTYLFDVYLETGFNKRNKDVLEAVSQVSIKNQDVKDAVSYLKSVVSRENNDWDNYFALNNSIQAIKNWQYCGVFENLNKSGLDRYYEPESIAHSITPFDAKSNGLVNWYTPKNNREAYQFFTNHESYGAGVNYAQTFISASEEQRAIIRIGSGSSFKVWLNDVLVFQNNEDVSTDLNAYKVMVTIPKGDNRLLIKLAESGYGSYFITSILNEDGSPNTNLSYSSEFKPYKTSTLSEINPEIIDNNFEIYFKNKVKENPTNFLYTYCLVNTYLRNSKYEEAKNVLKPFYTKYPKSSLIRKMLIQASLIEGDNTSFTELKKNMELDDPDYYLPLVYKVIDFGELSRMTVEELKNFLDKFKKSVDNKMLAYMSDFVYNSRKEDMEALKQNLDDLFQVSKDNVKMLLRCAPLYGSLLNEDDKTVKLLEEINSNYFNYSGITTLSRYYANRKEKDKSLKILSKDLDNLAFDNTYIIPIIEKQHTYQKYSESLEYINKGLENFPYSFKLMELKGDALLKLDDKKNALLAYENSLKHDGSNSRLRNKIRDLKNEKNVLNEISFNDAYNYIKSNRGKIPTNNYGYNILRDDSNIELFTEGGGKYRFIYLYEVTSNSGIEFFKEYDLSLSGNYHISKSEIVKTDGSVVPADKSGSNLVFKGLSIGDVVYIDYESSFSNSGRFYRDYTDSFMFDSFHPALKSTLKIITPKNHKLFYKVVNGKLDPQISKLDNYDMYEWKTENLPEIPQEEYYMPNTVDVAKYLHISTIPSWNDISMWYSDLVRSSIEVDTSVKDVFNTLFPKGYKHLNDEDKAKIIYNYIKNNFTYSYVSFRQSGYVPQKPSKTIKTSLGDCKDFSTLFVTLANMAELKANMVLVLTSDYGRNEMVMPNTDFNHCIAKVEIDGKEQYLELTNKYLPFKSLPVSLRGASVLEIPFNLDENKKYDLFKLDNVLRDASVFTNEVDINIANDKVTMSINTKFTGHINSYYANVFDEPNLEVVKKSIHDDLNNQIKEDFVLDELTNIERLDDDKVIKYTSNISLDKKINKIGSINIFQLPLVSHPYTTDIVSLESRQYPIEYIQYENLDEYYNTYNLFISEGMSFIEIPKDQKFTFKDHLYEIAYSKVKENHLKISMHAKPSLEKITVEEYQAFKAYVKSILDAENEFIGYK